MFWVILLFRVFGKNNFWLLLGYINVYSLIKMIPDCFWVILVFRVLAKIISKCFSFMLMFRILV